MAKEKILIIDDDKEMTRMLATFLQLKGFEVQILNQPDLKGVVWEAIDLVLLDINMPDKNGFELCQEIRNFFSAPILFLTARSSEEDKVKGLMLGGDDYITKPFSLEELHARIYTNIYRDQRERALAKPYEFKKGKFYLQGEELSLTRIEYELLDLLARHPQQIFSKEQIYEILWGYEAEGDDQVVAEHIRKIRNKIKDKTSKEFIKTHWGRGYSWIG